MSASLACLVAGAAAVAQAVAGPVAPRSDPVVLAAGDIAACDRTADEETAALVAREPRAIVLTLGDQVYPAGAPETYRYCYQPSWGSFKERTRPATGNHDVLADGGRAYDAYFGRPRFYAFDLGSWRVYSLDSETTPIDELAAWLDRDLLAHPHRCVLAYWHRPRFSSGHHGSSERTAPLWEVLRRRRADVVLSGHDHHYERFWPQAPDGTRAKNGIRAFVVGTGGAGLYDLDPDDRLSTSQVASNTAHGVLRLVLHAGSYSWRFVALPGEPLVDRWTGRRLDERGRARCV
jgi:hypothetical protein